jgi:hypothetical protein
MTDDNNFDAIQIDQEILTYTVSDEALEAAAGTERARWAALVGVQSLLFFAGLSWRPLHFCCAKLADPRLRQRATDHSPRPMTTTPPSTPSRSTKISSPTQFPTRHWKLPRARRGGTYTTSTHSWLLTRSRCG